MKKLFCLLAVALVALPGCGNETNSTTATASKTAASVEAAEADVSAEESAPEEDGSSETAATDGVSEDATSNEVASTEEASDKEASDKEASGEDASAEESFTEQADTQPASKPASAEPAPQSGGDRVVSGDWPQWGGGPAKNMVNKSTQISIDFDVEAGKKVLWTAELGSQTYANPVVAEGIVIVGTNNGAERRPKHKGDRGVLMAFDAKSGEFKWQLTREKLPDGRVNDWPEQGICSTPVVENGRVYVVTNRCEIQCLDLKGFHDGENNGPYTHEVDAEKEDADIIWSLDMMEELGVFPHNLATSSPVIHGDKIFITTSNGVDEAHLEIPSPRAPSFLAVNKNTGEVVWEDNSPEDKILHGQWSSPAIGIVNGKAQVYMPGGDGWLYAFDAESNDEEAKLLWKFDLNPKDSVWELGGAGTRNAIIATPVFHENSVVLAVGQDPEHAEGVGHIYRIDATKTGDISPQIEDGNGGFKANPNSGQIWHLGGIDKDGSITGEEDGLIFRRTLSTVSIHEGLVYAADLSGFVHCLDFKTGKQFWEYDTFSAIWGSTLVADGKVFIGDEDGELTILKTGKEKKMLAEKLLNSSVYSTPTIANGILYVSDRSKLYAIDTKK